MRALLPPGTTEEEERVRGGHITARELRQRSWRPGNPKGPAFQRRKEEKNEQALAIGVPAWSEAEDSEEVENAEAAKDGEGAEDAKEAEDGQDANATDAGEAQDGVDAKGKDQPKG